MMLAEGGTEYGHRVTIQRSRRIEGPYEKCPANPILSHQDRKNPVQATGHGDIFEDGKGQWWMVFLGVRPINGSQLHHLGRETFLTPLAWSGDGWPVVGVGVGGEMSGRIEQSRFPEPPGEKTSSDRIYEDFRSGSFSPEWNFIRNPEPSRYLFAEGGKGLILRGTERELTDPEKGPTFAGIRQCQFDTRTRARLHRGAVEGQKGGLCAYLNHSHHYEIYLTVKGGQTFLEVSRRIYDLEAVEYARPHDINGYVDLIIESDREDYRFSYALEGEETVAVASGKTMGLCTEIAYPMNFTGVFLGLFSVRGETLFGEFESFQYS